MNLNRKYKRPSFFKRKIDNVRVYFNPTNILAALVREINRSENVYGCIAWCTHPKVLTAMENTDTALVMTKHKANRWKRNIRVKFIGKGRGFKASLMHHKFLVGANKGEPEWVAVGSFNITKGACNNLENMMVVHDKHLAKFYYDEYERLRLVPTR
tara:strand:- start:1576 stop:2043 length:468 start_codon:yes stop_codon:yes gene_type:complete